MKESATADQNFALKLLCETNSNIFLTGRAGTGKSWVIRQFREYCNSNNIRIENIAPTGVAAMNVGGQTVHRFFGIGAAQNPDQAINNAKKRKSVITERLNEVDVIIIDEISMLNDWVLDSIEKIAREFLQSEKPWGGKRLIVVGDFLQLAPVESKQIEPTSSTWAFTSDAWEISKFVVSKLDQVLRTSDEHFLSVLEDVRNGEKTQILSEFLKSRSSENVPPKVLNDLPHLMSKKIDALQFNEKKLEELLTPLFRFDTEYDVNNLQMDEQGIFKDDFPIAETFLVKVGAKVMFRNNDPDLRWANGTVGVVASINQSNQIIEIDIENGKREKVRPDYFILNDSKGREIASAKNFPLILAWGITIHKSQGMTLGSAVVDLKSTFACGQAYVAMSRLKSSAGLWIIDGKLHSITVDKDTMSFTNSLIAGEIAPRIRIQEETNSFKSGGRYSRDFVRERFDLDIDQMKLTVPTKSGQVIIIKASDAYNPCLRDSLEVWFHASPDNWTDKNRRKQAKAIIDSENVFPLFIIVPNDGQGRDLEYFGLVQFSKYLDDRNLISKHVANRIREEISVIVFLKLALLMPR